MNAPEPVVRNIEDMVTYCPVTGVFRWKVVRRESNAKVGDIAGALERQGYWRLRTNRKCYLGHRVAWRIMTGEWPAHYIDHKNRVRSDNRWDNLRLATQSQNQANRGPQGKYPKGVRRNAAYGRYTASIRCNGTYHYLGSFDTPEQAGAAYEVAAKLLFGEYARTAKSPHAQFEFSAQFTPQDTALVNPSDDSALAGANSQAGDAS